MTRKRSETDRRARQCERMGRILRILQLIQQGGQWDAAALAKEIECSERTIHRALQVIQVGGIPVYFDDACRSYRIRPGFHLPILNPRQTNSCREELLDRSPEAAQRILAGAQDLVQALTLLRRTLNADEQEQNGGP